MKYEVKTIKDDRYADFYGDCGIRVDDAAPLYYIDHTFEDPDTLPECHFIVSENDMPGRFEQVRLTINTMLRFGYPENKLIYSYMPVYTHGGYVFVKPENVTSPFIELILKLIFRKQ